MAQTIDSRVVLEIKSKRADLNARRREQDSRLKGILEEFADALVEYTTVLVEDIHQYCDLEQAKIFKQHPEFRKKKEIEAEKKYLGIVY